MSEKEVFPTFEKPTVPCRFGPAANETARGARKRCSGRPRKRGGRGVQPGAAFASRFGRSAIQTLFRRRQRFDRTSAIGRMRYDQRLEKFGSRDRRQSTLY